LADAAAYTRLAGVYDELVVDPCHGAWAAFLDELWAADENGVRSVLDVCCGTGLLAAELRSRDYRVVGTDASEAMLDQARLLLGSEVPLVQATLPDLPVEGVFDAAVSTFDGLNYLSPTDLRSTLAAIAGHLRPGGWLVFDVHTDAMMAFTAANPVVAGQAGDTRFEISSSVDTADRICDTRIVLEPGDDAPFGELHRQYFHSADEIRAALAEAGLGVVSVTAEYSDRPVDDVTMRATWVARIVP
jgi:SAM-dependent methyltransferase